MSDSPKVNIAQWFHRSALSHGLRPALYVEERYYSYQALLDHLTPIASTIERLDTRRAAPIVALFAYRSLTAYAALLGILYAGKGYLPLNPLFPVTRNQHIVDLGEVELLILDRHCEPQGHELLLRVRKNLTVLLPDHPTLPAWTESLPRHRFLDQRAMLSVPSHLLSPSSQGNSLAYLLFTSGTTGVPKGVMVTHENVDAFVANMLDRYQPTPEDRFSQHSDMTFDASVYDQLVCWAAGACLYPIPQKVRMAPGQFIKEHALTFWESVPAVIQFMRRMYQLKPGAFPSLRLSVFGGEQLTREAARWWQNAAPNSRIDNSYGPTEGTICITGHFWRDGPDGPDGDATLNGVVPIGMPYPGQRTAILVEGQLVHNVEGAKGELCLSGSQVTPGYWRNDQETARSYPECADADGRVGRWYRTGDLVLWKNGVGLYYLDRVDRQLKIRGYRVELAEIEQVMRQVAKTGQVAVVGWPRGGDNITSVIGFVCGSTLSDEEILEGCARRLPPYMVPRHLLRLAQLPLNANGKTDSGQLLDMVRLDT
ncbi:MAG: AMP-binding protein [Magnetococcales bacterium]|nr:AMP-binding protein [Magnetococcales bacterium]